jgi:hypothetical protein
MSNCHGFVEVGTTLGYEVWIVDAAKIRASAVHKQKIVPRGAGATMRQTRALFENRCGNGAKSWAGA